MRKSYIHVMLSAAVGLALVACDEGNGESSSSGQAQKMQPESKGASKSGGLEAPSGKKKLGSEAMKARRKAMKKKIAQMKKRKAMKDKAMKAAEKAEKKGDTPCEKAYHAAIAASDSMRKQRGKKAEGKKPEQGGFVSACKELPDKFQKCLIPSYTRENRGKCAKLHKNADDKVKGQIRNLMKQMK